MSGLLLTSVNEGSGSWTEDSCTVKQSERSQDGYPVGFLKSPESFSSARAEEVCLITRRAGARGSQSEAFAVEIPLKSQNIGALGAWSEGKLE
ncbi:MAG TPA: hypothetical protein VIH31_02230, partial [Candidatus Paceibacterota bacterium]